MTYVSSRVGGSRGHSFISRRRAATALVAGIIPPSPPSLTGSAVSATIRPPPEYLRFAGPHRDDKLARRAGGGGRRAAIDDVNGGNHRRQPARGGTYWTFCREVLNTADGRAFNISTLPVRLGLEADARTRFR